MVLVSVTRRFLLLASRCLLVLELLELVHEVCDGVEIIFDSELGLLICSFVRVLS